MNNVNKIRKVIDLSKPVRIGDTLYVANAVGKKVTAPPATEKIILKNGAAYEVAEAPKLRKLSELTTDEAQKVIAVIDEYAEYYRNAADKAEQAEIIQKLIKVCADELGVDDPMIITIFNARVQQAGNSNWWEVVPDLPDATMPDAGGILKPDMPEMKLPNIGTGRTLNLEQSFFERYKVQILVGVIIYLLLRDKR